MDFSRQMGITQTPFRHIQPHVIYTDRQGNQLDQASISELKECRHPSGCNWETAIGAEKGSNSNEDAAETSRECSIANTPTWNIMSLDDPLLALADAASKEYSFPETNPLTIGNYAQEPKWEKANAFSAETTSQFAPVTPDKGQKVESKKVTEMQNLFTYARRKQEIRKSGIASRRADASDLQTDKEPQKQATNSSFAVMSPVLKEDHIPDTGGSDVIDLNRTPQQKPRRKKHRPKVINERKTKGLQKSATPMSVASTEKPTGRRTPMSVASTEKPTGRRKYVRKKTLNKASTSSPAEANEESTNPKTIEPAKKSCRRALNFDVEGKSRDGSSKCRQLFDLYSEPEAQASIAINQSKSTMYLGHGIEVMVETTQEGIAYDLTRSINQMLKKYISLPEKVAPSTLFPARTSQRQDKQDGSLQETRVDQEPDHNVQDNIVKITPISPNGFNCKTSTTLTEEGQASRSKRKHSEQPDTCSTNRIGIHYSSFHAYQTLLFPKKRRTEKGQAPATSSISSSLTAAKDIVRVETTCPQKDPEGYPFTSKVNCWISAAAHKGNGLPATHVEERIDLLRELQTFGCTINQTTRTKKKRSRFPTKVRDMASLTRIPGSAWHPTKPNRQVFVDRNGQQVGDTHRPHMSVEALLAEMKGTWTTKKRTKKRASLVNSGSYSVNAAPSNGKIVLYNKNKFSAKSLGAHPEEIWKQMLSVDAIIEQVKYLDINRESNEIAFKEHNALVHYNSGNDMRNALVLYKRDGTIVPYDSSFGSTRKRRPRPKVDLDQETNRVWMLLMGNINSEGIDGTDEEKAKWWEEERTVFSERAHSFITRMHLVQGDRRFSPWKGSVLDSVIGVFLTQNVSDHLSSSAFMSLAARFPLKSKNKPRYDESMCSVIETPIVLIPDSEEGMRWNEKSNQSICDQSSMTIHDIELDEEQEVVNSSESFGSSTGIVTSETEPHTFSISMASRSTTEISMTERVSCMVEERTEIIDAISSQNSVISGQNSLDSPIAQASERKESCSENISEGEDLTDGSKLNNYNDCTSFMELLQKVGSPMLHDAYSQGNAKIDNLNDRKSPFEVSMVTSSNCYLHHTSNSGALKVDCFDKMPEETEYGDITKKKNENGLKDHNAPAVETASQISNQNKLTLINQEASRSPTSNPSCSNIQKDKHMSVQSTAMPVEDPTITHSSLIQMQNNYMQKNQDSLKLSGETTHITGSTSTAFDRQQKNPRKTRESEMIELGYSQRKELNEMNAATRKAKSRRVGNEIRDDVDWDALRKQAEANGKRERTANTMDSLDWEAVRCADVNDIANTIKERGMNNMLAERIKNLLNRLVREHGSIDLEWLRDIPPDKAKEYLLSIRGLGLKSVECVRLLTLHHLAFPVDTNVGRIAVRLGWVPLQPLPESLQLHLLELYPVLESIQKYLWPRLCKLDQRTLYELHYQLITFGKVFCTKSKPNCNACPMRGECRHFASAFASARLALPGPEEKSIVSATENRTGHNPAVKADQLPLPLSLPQTTEQSEANRLAESKSRITFYEPIIEEPSSPEPVSTQATENDMEDTFCEDPDEIPTIKLNIEEFTQNLQNYMQENMALQEADMSKALVALTTEAASIPVPKLKNVSRLRTEHQVYELPDSHPLLQGLDRREPDDPSSYLLSIWTPGETANSIQPPESSCSSQECGKLCDEKTCFSCNSIREANSQIVRGTLLIPCRTAMSGRFPLNGTYFQVNEVFADHDSSLHPIDVPRSWLWNLRRLTVYFGTSIPTIFRGLTTEGIQHCFFRGHVCLRGIDLKTRAPRPLIARLHFPASKLSRTEKGGAGGK